MYREEILMRTIILAILVSRERSAIVFSKDYKTARLKFDFSRDYLNSQEIDHKARVIDTEIEVYGSIIRFRWNVERVVGVNIETPIFDDLANTHNKYQLSCLLKENKWNFR